MVRRKTNEEYIKECKEKGYDLPIDEYVNNRTKIKHKCKKCGNTYKQTPSSHLQGNACPYCYGTPKKTNEYYVKECEHLGYDLPIEEYEGAHTRIKHTCKNNHIYLQAPHVHLKGNGCPYCSGMIKKYNKDYYIQQCKELGVDLPIETYVDSNTKIKYKCIKCGNVYEQAPSSHLQGQGCPLCAGNKKKATQQYIEECKQLELDLPIEGYVGAKTSIKHKCAICDSVYKQKPNDHLGGHGCPYCSQSRGERYIRNYLDKYNIVYVSQKTFNDLKDKRSLSYDFYLPKQNVLIEYQGIQHFESVSFDGKVSSDIQKQQYHDKLKCEYAINNGYKLLEPTYELDTQEKINKYLDKHI